jgi:hypothetical protein
MGGYKENPAQDSRISYNTNTTGQVLRYRKLAYTETEFGPHRFRSYLRYQTIVPSIARPTIIIGNRSSNFGAIFIRPVTAPNAITIRKMSHAFGVIAGNYTLNLYFF